MDAPSFTDNGNATAPAVCTPPPRTRQTASEASTRSPMSDERTMTTSSSGHYSSPSQPATANVSRSSPPLPQPPSMPQGASVAAGAGMAAEANVLLHASQAGSWVMQRRVGDSNCSVAAPASPPPAQSNAALPPAPPPPPPMRWPPETLRQGAQSTSQPTQIACSQVDPRSQGAQPRPQPTAGSVRSQGPPGRQQAPQREQPAQLAQWQQQVPAPRDPSEQFGNNALCGLLSYTSPPGLTAATAQAAPAKVSRSLSRNGATACGTGRCIQCGKQVEDLSSLDHTCPKCSAVVCHNCVDDFRLILESYRCPRCGDQTENQALLRQNAWYRGMYRSARAAYVSMNRSWATLFSSEEVDDPEASSNGRVGCCGKGWHVTSSEIASAPDSKATPQQSQASRPDQLQAAAPRPAAKPPASNPATAQPDHRTRLPAGWEEAGVDAQGVLRRLAGQDLFQTVPPKK